MKIITKLSDITTKLKKVNGIKLYDISILSIFLLSVNTSLKFNKFILLHAIYASLSQHKCLLSKLSVKNLFFCNFNNKHIFLFFCPLLSRV